LQGFENGLYYMLHIHSAPMHSNFELVEHILKCLNAAAMTHLTETVSILFETAQHSHTFAHNEPSVFDNNHFICRSREEIILHLNK